MTELDLKSKLTPAAREALDELVDDYRRRVLLGARDCAAGVTGEIREITVNDLMRSIRRQNTRGSGAGSVLERISRVYIAAGLFVTVGGLLASLAQYMMTAMPIERRMPLVVAVAGMIVSALGFVLRFAKPNHIVAVGSADDTRLRFPEDATAFLADWQELELGLRTLAAAELGESTANTSVSSLISMLGKSGLLTAGDDAEIRRLLQIRNQLVHGQWSLTPKSLEDALKTAKSLLSKLNLLMQHR